VTEIKDASGCWSPLVALSVRLLRSKIWSAIGTSRHCAAAQQFSRFRSEADMGKPFAEPNL